MTKGGSRPVEGKDGLMRGKGGRVGFDGSVGLLSDGGHWAGSLLGLKLLLPIFPATSVGSACPRLSPGARAHRFASPALANASLVRQPVGEQHDLDAAVAGTDGGHAREPFNVRIERNPSISSAISNFSCAPLRRTSS